MKYLNMLVYVSVCALATGTAHAQQAASDGAASQQSDMSDSIVVTGEKFGRTLQDSSTSVGLLTSEQIEDQMLLTATDTYDQLVNVNLAGANNRFVIRGIPFDNVNGAGFGQLGTTYVDGVRLGDKSTAFGPDLLWDVQSIEVLRGAQSTLQGRNALAGAIYINTNAPTFSYEARARAIVNDNGDTDFAVAAGGPIVDDLLAFRATAQVRRADGFIYNRVRGTDEAKSRDEQYRLKLLFTPGSDITVNGVFNYADINRSDASADTRALDDDGYLTRSSAGKAGFESGVPGITSAWDRVSFNNIDEIEKNRTITAGLTVDWRLGGGITLTSQTTYEDTDDYERDDGDSGYFNYSGYPGSSISVTNPYNIGNFSYTADGTVPVDPIGLQSERFSIFAQELRLKYDRGGRFRALAGLYYTHEREREDNFSMLVYTNVQPLVASAARAYVDASTASLVASLYNNDAPLYTFNAQPVDVDNYAAYGELEYDLTSRLTLTAGLRYDREDNKSGVINSGAVAGLLDPASVPIAALAPLVSAVNAALDPFAEAQGDAKLHFDAWLPKVSLRYDITPGNTIGAVYQRAYRAGGVSVNVVRQIVTELKPEYTDNYELFFRSDLGGLGRLTANAFLTNWKDQQATASLSTMENDQVGVNAGKSQLYGFEIEFAADVTDTLKLNGGLGYTHIEFKEFDLTLPESTTALGIEVDPDLLDGLEGNSFAYAPKWSAVLGATYRRGPFSASANVNYQGDSWADIQNRRRNGDRILVNGRIGYDFGPVSLSLFGRNLFNQKYYLSYDETRSSLGDPRVVGAVLEARF